MTPQPKNAPLTLPGANIAETMQRYRGRLQENPEDIEAWTKTAALLEHLGHDNAALACLNRALELSPASPSLLLSRGVLLTAMDRFAEALDSHAAAYAAAPDDLQIRHNYAVALRTCGRLEEALAHFHVLCDRRPQDYNVRYERAVAYFLLARFKEGWKDFEARKKYPSMKKFREDKPRWQGEDLTGKTILIQEEQGFGDILLCSRYIPLVRARGGRIIFECQKALHRLFQSIPGIDEITELEPPAESFDCQIPLMDLPGIFGTELHSIPPLVPMNIPASPPAEAARLLELGRDRFKVGVVWSGGERFEFNHKRAVHPRRFLPLTEIPGIQLYSLQKGSREKELAECGGRSLILELGHLVNDFADTAAVLKNLDLVIMTDSSVAHLAGTIGCPVWNLLGCHPYWLYLNGREDSPWYPSMRLLRQPDPGNWDALFKKTAEELKKAVALKKSGKWKGVA
jgi:tetratricopeptide (TPR) repeat protein